MIDPWLVVAGLLVGIVVGLTGMGGGALMTPVLVLLFGVQPLAAVSSDLVAAAVMKPVGSLVHLRRGTVNLQLVKWLCIGSIPTAFGGVLLLKLIGNSESVQSLVKVSLGVALLVASGAMVLKAYLRIRTRGRRDPHERGGAPEVVGRILPTVAIGSIGGLIVGITSVGSGSLIIISLLFLYPALSASQLVGTDLVQAVPLVASAALAHLMFGDFQLDLTVGLLLGAIPGVWFGARLSAQAPGGIIRRALALVLFASGLKLVGLGTVALGLVIGAVLVAAPLFWGWVRSRHGLRPFKWTARRHTASKVV